MPLTVKFGEGIISQADIQVIISVGEYGMEDWLTTYEAATMSGYNPDYIRQLIRGNKVQGRKWGLAWQVNRQSLEIYMKEAEKLGDRRGAKPKADSKRR